MSRSVLISGAGIAGPALALWLHRYGMTPTVVERAAEPRLGGQTVDLRGAGRTVIERMGLAQAARERVTREEGVRFVDGGNRVRASFGSDALGGDGFVTELELLRGDLADLLHQRTRDDTEYLFGDEVTGLTETGDGVDVTFRTGPDRRFDLVVLADGFRSRTRGLAFADIARTRSFGLYTAYFTIPRAESDGRWARWYNAPGRRVVLLRPDNQGTTRASLSFLTPRPGLDRLESPAQKRFLRHHYADAGWETTRVLDHMDGSADFHFESVGQMRLEQWSRGRIAVVGDAGYCASPLSGMGTSLALVGAYVLAGELDRHSSHRDAFRAYENTMRPYVTQAQKVSWFAPRLASPKTRTGIRILHALAHLATDPRLSRFVTRFTNPPSDAVDLPAYRTRH
ncbi:FAD-dependent monooxygenase [Actinokineospora auranticolor]|uniref:2-polyprenyl-6-methoxyphenol hydroxylase-like FAD-dependent oxidoreductase n=1 Tax=Actinokineospora auranticolor TaxID=155976 RepID=A0A2S6GIW0_9PSEU|nr:FAD-dependent monooxygenase [Actinokineospora auranticolor]PPK65091.1 2-polyprenyl-6-methoxyphenol hydroxylase-like FAD-dependent oxidoreductase [Actinokineospora auranticolor]